jgi:hypothetical protein
MHPFIVERPRDLAAALALRAQAGRNDAPAEYIAGDVSGRTPSRRYQSTTMSLTTFSHYAESGGSK